jgi:solute carrier family 25 S-adenosylmethionine transporter 26
MSGRCQFLCIMQPSTFEDLLMGGLAGTAAAAATTPLDVVKTRMMCSASSRPTISQVCM